MVSYDIKERIRHQSLASAKRRSDMNATIKHGLESSGNDEDPQPRSGASLPRGENAQHSS